MISITPGSTQTGHSFHTSDDIKNRLEALGASSQTADYPALAAMYLHQTSTMNGRSIYTRDKRFRELELGVTAASETIYGDKYSGKPYEADPELMRLMREMAIRTII